MLLIVLIAICDDCRYTISQHPRVEAKVVEELERLELLVTPERPQPRPLEYADLARLTYLNCVIRVSSPLNFHI